VVNQRVFKERLADFKMRWQIWTPPNWQVLREVGGFSNAPADLNWAHTWQVSESWRVFKCAGGLDLSHLASFERSWRVLKCAGGFKQSLFGEF
jgi:hypothetical protein